MKYSFNCEDLNNWVKKTSKKGIRKFIESNDFDFTKNILYWLYGDENSTDEIYEKYCSIFCDVQEDKILKLAAGEITFDSFTNREVFEYLDKIIDDTVFINDKRINSICDINSLINSIEERKKELIANYIINFTNYCIIDCKIDDDELVNIINSNYNNLYDIFLEITSNKYISLEQRTKKIVDSIINGQIPMMYKNKTYNFIGKENFKVGYLKDTYLNSINVDDNNGSERMEYYTIENPYDIYTLDNNINPLLRNLDIDYKNCRQYINKYYSSKNGVYS